MKNILCLVLNFALVAACSSQEKYYKIVVKSIETQLETMLHFKYYVHVFDIDKSVNNPVVAAGKIKNPYGTLSGCFIFLAEAMPDANLNKQKGFIGIYKADSILWRSDLLTEDFSSLSGEVSSIDELNKDGKVEIVVSQYLEPHGTSEQLWIFNWDGTNGKLITQLDDDGASTIVCMVRYILKDVDRDGIYEIQGKDPDSKKTLTYSWNGSLYGKWGKSSKYLLKGKHK
jgi:hypothetical protein